MRQLLRQSVERMPAPLPIWIQGVFRYLRYPQVRRRRVTHRRILRRLDGPTRVSQGPFQGMRYVGQAYCSEILPKLAGTYECELIPAIEMICRSDCDRIIDIGAAEGYYAVGMAMCNPAATVVSFEMNPSARYYLRQLAWRNGVSDRITIEGECLVDSLRSSLAGAHRPAVICDCEGAEDQLLYPDQIDSLRRALILVETHDGLETDKGVLEGITCRLRERFAPTHEVEVIASRSRGRDQLSPEFLDLTNEEADEAMNEGRTWAQWLFLKPRPSPPNQVSPQIRCSDNSTLQADSMLEWPSRA